MRDSNSPAEFYNHPQFRIPLADSAAVASCLFLRSALVSLLDKVPRMQCSNCQGTLTAVGRFLVCGRCGFTCPADGVAIKPKHDAPVSIADEPSILAIPLTEYYAETH